MERKFRMIIAAHDKKKEDLIGFLRENRQLLDRFDFLTTRNTGSEIHKRTKLKITFLSQDADKAQAEALLLLSKRAVDGVIYLRESVSLYSYDLNLQEINQACDEYEIPMGTNIQTAQAIINHLRGSGEASVRQAAKFPFDNMLSLLNDFKTSIIEEVRHELGIQNKKIESIQESVLFGIPQAVQPQAERKVSKEEEMKNILSHLYQEQKANAYVLRKRFGMGYNRAVKIIDLLEKQNFIGPVQEDGNRKVFIKESDFT